MLEELGPLTQQDDPAARGRHQGARGGVGEDAVALPPGTREHDAPRRRHVQAGHDAQQGRLPRAVRADHRQGPPGRDGDVDADVAGAVVDGDVQPAHAATLSVNPRRKLRVPPAEWTSATTITATITSSMDSATAASGSVSRWR